MVILIGLVVYAISTETQRASTTTNEIKTTSLTKQKLSESVIVSGYLKLSDTQTITYDSTKGEIKEILVKEGDKVKKGDALIRYENDTFTYEQKQNDIKIELAYLDLNTIQKKQRDIEKKLKKDKDNKELKSELDSIKLQEQQKNLEIRQLQLEKDSLQQKISNQTITSKMDGTVIFAADSTNGSEQSEQMTIMQIGSLDNMLVSGKISEYDSLKIKKGQSVKLTSDAMPGESWSGKVFYVSLIPEQTNEQEDQAASYKIETKIDKANLPFKPGFKMLMEVESDQKTTYALPLTAVKRESDEDYVYVVEDNKAVRKKVKTGLTTAKNIEIIDGLKTSEKVILNPDGVTEGMEVTAS